MSPSEYYRIKIDGVLKPVGSKFSITPGSHLVNIWAPNYQVFDSTITVSKEKTVLRIQLSETPELIKYQNYLEKKSELNARATASGVGIILLSGAAGLNYNRIGRYNLELTKAYYRSNFTTATGTVTGNEYPAAEGRHNRSIITQGVLYTGMGISTLLFVKYFVLKKKLIKPQLIKDTSFEVEDLGLVPYTNGLGIGLKLNLIAK